MKRPKIVSEEECARLNSLAKLYRGQTLQRKDLKKLLTQEMGWSNNAVFEALQRFGVIVRQSRGLYFFQKDPIYIGKLRNIFADVAKKSKGYYEERKKTVPCNKEQESIDYLKGLGYKVIKVSFEINSALTNMNKPVGEFLSIKEF